MRQIASLSLLASFSFAFAATAQDFPEGPGKETVTTVCGGCHEAGRVRAGYTPEGWRTVMTMMRNMGAPVPDGQWPVVEAYLAKNFPERPCPAAVTLEGPATASFRTWPVPTRARVRMIRARPRMAPCGTPASLQVAWAASIPRTGAIREFPLDDHPGPHGLAEDKDGRSGLRPIAPAPSGASIRKPAMSPIIPCPIRTCATRTR